MASSRRAGVEVIRDVPYKHTGLGEHRLDIYRPAARTGPCPIMFYVHGGGFRILSKDTHWLFGLRFARQGFIVFNISYRLAPRHPFPAAIEDTCDAYRWMIENAAHYGGDLERIVAAGESAGANLVTGLAVAQSYARPEPWARSVFEVEPSLRGVLPACGLLQVTDTARFWRRKPKLPGVVIDQLSEVTKAYLGSRRAQAEPHNEMADPLLVLERGQLPYYRHRRISNYDFVKQPSSFCSEMSLLLRS